MNHGINYGGGEIGGGNTRADELKRQYLEASRNLDKLEMDRVMREIIRMDSEDEIARTIALIEAERNYAPSRDLYLKLLHEESGSEIARIVAEMDEDELREVLIRFVGAFGSITSEVKKLREDL